jgi:chaperonin GroES
MRKRQKQYRQAIWFGKNTSGCEPIGDKILISPDIFLSETEAGVFMPDEFKERMQLSTQSGVIVAVGDDAFTWSADRMRPFGGYKPKPGDRVYYERYAGAVVQGDDNTEYRLIEDKQIGAVIEKAK